MIGTVCTFIVVLFTFFLVGVFVASSNDDAYVVVILAYSLLISTLLLRFCLIYGVLE